MLPDDSKARRKQALDENLRQTNVNDHFKPAPKEEKLEPYSDELFKQTAIEWLIVTNQVKNLIHINDITLISSSVTQPIQAFDHEAFQKMINTAARATRGINLPSRKQTRNEIIRMFKEQMKALKERLNVSSTSFVLMLSYLLLLHFRVRLFAVRLALPVMHGRRQMPMHILLSPVIGLKKKRRTSGCSMRPFLASHR